MTITSNIFDASSAQATDEVGSAVVQPESRHVNQIEINGTTLCYTDQGQGELVILVHGALGDYRTWSRQVALLARQYRVVSYSRRYHAPNAPPKRSIDYTYRRHVDDLISLISTLGSGPAHLVGRSYGAAVAALAAMERPDLVSSLVLGEPTLFWILSDSQDRVLLRLHRIALRVVERLSDNNELGLALREYVNIVFGKDIFDDLPLEAKFLINQNAHTLGPMLRTHCEPTRLSHTSARKITAPTLLITGEFSPSIYKAITRELNNRLPCSDSFILPGASHGLQIENPNDFGAALMEFLSGKERA